MLADRMASGATELTATGERERTMTHRSWPATGLCAAALCVAFMACKRDGVDLSAGGTELVYRPALSGEADDARAGEVLTEARRVVLARLKELKVPAAALVEGRELKVRLARDVAAEQLPELGRLLGIRGRLELREIDHGAAIRALAGKLPPEAGVRIEQDAWTGANGSPRGAFTLVGQSEASVRGALAAVADFELPEGVELLAERPLVPDLVRLYAVRPVAIAGDAVQGFSAPRDPYLPPEVAIAFTPEGGERFAQFTRRILGRKMAIVLDGEIQETAVVLAPVTLGRASITQGRDGEDRKLRQRKADLLAAMLRGGVLPAPLELAEERSIAGR
jgi:hypothetical protein